MTSRVTIIVSFLLAAFISLTVLLSFAGAATPVVTQKPVQVQPARPATKPAAPPPASITITVPPGGKVWRTGTTEPVQWTCKNINCLVDVGLWQGGRQVAVIGANESDGQASFSIPANTAAGGYEIRVVSKVDSKVTARQSVTIQAANAPARKDPQAASSPAVPSRSAPAAGTQARQSVVIVKPAANQTWRTGTSETIEWKCTNISNPLDVSLWLNNQFVGMISRNDADGQAAWAIPANLANGTYEIRISDKRVWARQFVTISGTPKATTNMSSQTAQQPGTAVKPAANPMSSAPQGSITITAPPNGTTWYTGSWGIIEWSCNNTRSKLVNITLWAGNYKYADIASNASSGRASWSVPANLHPGAYEVRVTSDVDTRVVARQPVTITTATISVLTPREREALTYGAQYKITWTYKGDPGTVKLSLKGSGTTYMYWPGTLSAITQANGQGSAVWTIHSQPVAWKPDEKFQITVASEKYPQVSGASGWFGLVCSKNNCNGICVDIQTNPNHCGNCTRNCISMPNFYNRCVNGKCACWEGWIECPGPQYSKCTDILNDPKNCGTCGKVCSNSLRCTNGKCTCMPPWAFCPMTAECVNLQEDYRNCGACGNQCKADAPVCFQGKCKPRDPIADLQTVLPSPLSQ